ncbi:MAG: YdbL family protein [Oleispira antarctica]|uniref:DUF1318 domain-containing protein n=1 Tax=Oleispira antarctica RB-8 TaxID=698738 RepID=R4YRK6_OLEAN|nr:YdbL family protein [Oleispira antarctica]MBQ0792421.1 YdbL family protein [Oleispira antarctica]CCK77722.1 conserved hypothetical protein [Oleispira antarctica RB-8]
MTLKSLFIAASLLIMSQLALALTLDEAQNKGLLGENASGYLEMTPRGNAEAKTLMTDINAQRKTKYQSIADKQKTELKSIEKIAGEKIINKLNTGEFFKDSNGQWHKK